MTSNSEYVAKTSVLTLGLLTLIAGVAEALVLLRIAVDPWKLFAVLESLGLVLGAFVGLASTSFTRQLRQWVVRSFWIGLALPFLLLVPYIIFALGTHTFSWRAISTLTLYLLIPTLLLLPDRLHRAERAGWRDFAAMLALAFPVGAHWLMGIWTWPQELYFFQPLFCVCVGGYGFIVIRDLEGVGYRFTFRKGDFVDATTNFVAFALLAIPIGILLGFIHPHGNHISVLRYGFQAFGIYLTVALPEELLFRGILQNFLVKTIPGKRSGLYGLLIASVIFGASHLHHAPVPNWRYGLLATLAGMFYGNAYRSRKRLPASALAHTLVDTTWHFWF